MYKVRIHDKSNRRRIRAHTDPGESQNSGLIGPSGGQVVEDDAGHGCVECHLSQNFAAAVAFDLDLKDRK